MDLERLVAALGAVEVVGRAPVEVRDLAYDARHVTPGAALLLRSRARGPTATTSRPRRWSAARSRSSSSAPLELGVPQVVVRDARAAMAVAADEFFGRPTEELAGRRCDGHERQDDDVVPALRDPRRRRAAAGPARHGRGTRRRRAARCRAHDAGGDRPAAHVPRDARRRRPLVRDGGVVARVAAAPARPRALRRPRLHEPEPGPPRLPRRHGVVLRGEAAPVRRRRPAGGGQRR